MKRKETIAEGVTLYLGDCREILPKIERVDMILADPPYGIGWRYASYEDSIENWYDLVGTTLKWTISNSRKSVFSVGSSIERETYILSNFPPKWRICWYKGNIGARCPIGFSNWEPLFVWGSGFGNEAKMHDYLATPGMWPKPHEIDHPCPKPLVWANWLITRMSKSGDTILDPFMGSGTSGISAVSLGRKFIGIEIEPKYFDLSCRRISDAIKQHDLFIEKPRPIQFDLME